MKNHHALAATKPPLSISGLSAALNGGDLVGGLFSSHEPNNLANLVDQMKSQGYEVGEPIKVTQRVQPGWTAWRLPITTKTASCEMLFFVPEDVC